MTELFHSNAAQCQQREVFSSPNPLDAVDPLAPDFSGLSAVLEQYIQGKPCSSGADVLRAEPKTLSQLGDKFQLSPFERAILLLCLGVEVEPNVRSLCARANDDPKQPYATLGLALSALPGADWSVLSPQNPLHYWQLIETGPGPILTQVPLKLDRCILCYLLGQPTLDRTLADRAIPLLPQETIGAARMLSSSHQAVAEQIVATWSAVPAGQLFPPIGLVGPDATILTQVAMAACIQENLELLQLSTQGLPTHIAELKRLQRCWEREAILTERVLLLNDYDSSLLDPNRKTAIALFLETLAIPAILIGCDRIATLRRTIVTLEVPPLTYDEQKQLWQTHLGSLTAELDGHVDRLAAQFQLSPSSVQFVCIQATRNVPDADSPNRSSALSQHLWSLCRQQARPSLDDLAQHIEATATWDDLVVPDRQREILHDIALHLQHRSRVYQQWGFAQKGDRGLGMSALFHGESGTGKTMAAEVLARSCELDLYRIDLSTVVNKYIGETEKNLRRIFDAAETGGVILLFDEADALFGKRSEVKDSHDRHANVEVSYLLQRLEVYRGLAILTSNLKDALDRAFLRRLRFMIPFPFPNAEARAQIWRRIFPPQTPQQNLDYDKLGQLNVAGGNIRNIALNAAFYAAAAGEPVQMYHILQATRREYLKLEKLLTNDETKGWDR